MSDEIIAEVTFFTHPNRDPIRVVLNDTHDGSVNIEVGNALEMQRDKAQGSEYNWKNAKKITGVTPEQLGTLIAGGGVIFDYYQLHPVTQVQEVLQAVK